MPRSFHIRAYSSMRSSAAAGIAPSEWLMRYVVSRRIGNRGRYSVSSMRRSLVRVESSTQAEVALGGADVTRGGPEQAARFLLLENVRRPARDPRAGEHRRREGRRDLGDVEDDGRVVLDVRGEDPVGGTLLQCCERRGLELLGHFDVRRPELLRRPLQDA